MKKISSFFLILIIIFASSCKKDEQNYSSSFKYKVLATKNGIPDPKAAIMFIFSSTEESVIQCDENGSATIMADKPAKLIVAMSSGYSGMKEVSPANDSQIKIDLENASRINKNLLVSGLAKYIGTFGVYQTDAAGDVKFRYQGTFIQYYCSSYLPSLIATNDPNGWDGWDLTDFIPWNGKKLLVPRQYQLYHRITYGFSISQALFLRANI